MDKEELVDYLKNNLKLVAGRGPGYHSMGGPQDGESEPGEIYIRLYLGEEMLSSVTVDNW